MRADAIFPSKYLKAADVATPQLLTISHLGFEELGDERKPVLYFEEIEKGIVLNRINTNTIIEAHGDETEAWKGKKIVLFESETDFQGKRTKCIRMRKPKATKQETEKALNDEVPF